MRWLLAFGLLAGCATPYHTEKMQEDGKTWEVWFLSQSGCGAYDGEEVCAAALKPKVEQRGKELCGAEPERVFACSKTAKRPVGYGCMVKCI